MSKSLVIVESPGKIRTVQKYLGPNYLVKASVGHCYEISPDENSIDIDNNFKIKYAVSKGKSSVVNELKLLSKKSDIVYIATDCDREGEAIGWHIAKRAVDKKTKVKRIRFQEITKSALQKAINNPEELDEHLFNAQQARTVVDRLVGYKVSPFLWRYVASKTSAGRVQSIGLKFICDRQKEIDDFKIEEFWTIDGTFLNLKKKKFNAGYVLKKKLKNKKQTDEVIKEIKKEKDWIVSKVEKSKKTRPPFPVFQTSTLQQFCASVFGWPAKRTMQIAQALYERGLITYHRTDSVNISKEAISHVRDHIQASYGNEYLPSKPIVYKSKSTAQEAHEGIRPTHIKESLEKTKNELVSEQSKLYEAIWRRFVACQMTNAEFDYTKVTINSREHTFSVTGQILNFDGFLKVYTYSVSKDSILPKINEGEKLKLENVEGKQHFTKPPPQYSDASLVKTLEEKGIGRPSTYASIIERLKKRKYVEDGKIFTPTELGKKVCEFLVKTFPELMNPNYTARVESELDDIAANKKVWQDVVEIFWKELEKHLKEGKEIGRDFRKSNVTEILCPKCKSNNLVKRFGRYGPFYGCNGFSSGECKAMFKIGENDQPVEIVRKEREYVEGKKCSCGGRLVIRESKKKGTKFAGCEKFPKCRQIYTTEGELIERKKDD